MPQDYEIVKGFKTEGGLGLYDYESLHGKPDIQGMIDDALTDSASLIDPTLQNEGQAADAKATGDAIRGLNEVYAPKVHTHQMNDVIGLSEAIEGANSAAEQALTDAKIYTNEQLMQYKVSVDTTLKNEGEAADAKAVGEAISQLALGVAYIDEEDNEIITLNYPSAEGVGF